MALPLPARDNRTYQQLRDEALARIPVHTPEWTNFNKSDPGVTLIEVFAFLAENLLYRSNLIPERNRLKFLNLLGVPLLPGSPARGLVTIANDRGPLQTTTLNGDLEVRAGQTPFRTELGLDVLPIEAQVFYKREATVADARVQEYYRQLYASYIGAQPGNASDARLYETVPFPAYSANAAGVSLSDTVDQSLWIALLLRSGDKPHNEQLRENVRKAIANRTLSLGILPMPEDQSRRHLTPLGQSQAQSGALLSYLLPDVPQSGLLQHSASGQPAPRYNTLPAVPTDDVLARPGIVQIRLPAAEALRLWSNLDPLETGVGQLPPALDDTAINERLITWLRITSPASVQARFLWIGINATPVTQRARIANELLPRGTGQPDQVVNLSQPPVIPGSLTLSVAEPNRSADTWQAIEDLFGAPSEVPVFDPRLPSPAPLALQASTNKVYVLDPESGEIRFGDGVHGKRPAFDAVLRASYDRSMGAAGNVGVNAINTGPALPSGLAVSNPVPTWGGADPEDVRDGEKQVSRYLQHRDRLVTAEDFRTIAYRTPGIEVGRVEVLPAYNTEIGSDVPGDAAGAVTLMVIPRSDPEHPSAPLPDREFLDAICTYLEPRRLVTTEVFLRPPAYRAVWVSIGITLAPRTSLAQVTEAVKQTVSQFLSPLPAPGVDPLAGQPALFLPPAAPDGSQGWPLRKPVLRLELVAIASRVAGVALVNDVLLFDNNRNQREQVTMAGLQLPYLAGLAVGVGSAPPASSIPGFGGAELGTSGPGGAGSQGPGGETLPAYIRVPVIPEECR